ncbi:hypothetical protein BV898_19440 [Hypsibius exemplaris]|uniref:DDE-1 domain-containing protein n=1 Tax=Hypsibius exemplaris TaxID=2072580 RepID=A0A9X6RPL4_HYPEX|nr:hypothetical protein BV898_19440 [Hypsibius exemplaris]
MSDGLQEAVLAPLVLFDGVQELASCVENTEDDVLVCTNESGWMDDTTFTSFVKTVLIPIMPQEKNVIFLDGHFSHIYYLSFLETCAASDRDIKILVFPAGQTEKLQPLNKCVFGGVKYN